MRKKKKLCRILISFTILLNNESLHRNKRKHVYVYIYLLWHLARSFLHSKNKRKIRRKKKEFIQ